MIANKLMATSMVATTLVVENALAGKGCAPGDNLGSNLLESGAEGIRGWLILFVEGHNHKLMGYWGYRLGLLGWPKIRVLA